MTGENSSRTDFRTAVSAAACGLALLGAVALGAVALGAVALSGPALAQQDFSAVEIEAVPVTDTITMLVGAGGNIGVSAGDDGVFIIDDQYAPLSDKIMAAVAEISEDPVRFVINTHWHGDHTGGNEAFGKAGAVIIAHANVRKRMAAGQEMPVFNRVVEPAPAAALPVVTFTGETALHLNGEPAQIIPVAPAHTDGDAFIYWPESNVIHTGDLFFNGFYPFIDAWSGGGIDGMIDATAAVLALADDDTKIIPGHGPLAGKAELEAFRAMLVTVRDSAVAARDGGKTMREWMDEKPLAAIEADWGGGFLATQQFMQIVWAGLKE